MVVGLRRRDERGRRVLTHLANAMQPTSVVTAQKLMWPRAGTRIQNSSAGADDALPVRRAEAEALALDNRGPLILTETGKLHPKIVESFDRYGFYVLTGVIQPDELGELRADVEALLADTSAPLVSPSRWNMAAPLSDPTGGRGRSPGTMMRTYTPPAHAPSAVPRSLAKCLPNSDAALRLFGHPSLLAAAATLLGGDFVPGAGPSFQIKLPGLGPAVAWHQVRSCEISTRSCCA